MSYVASLALQKAIYSALIADVSLHEQVDGHVFDAPPSGEMPDAYVQLGEETSKGRSDASGALSRHDLSVNIVTTSDAFGLAKSIAARVSEVLHNADLSLERGELVHLRFLKARAQKLRGARGRRIVLHFRALIDAS